MTATDSLRHVLLGVLLVCVAGNLQPLLLWLTDSGPTHALAASRIIPHTITEFPLLSLLVGDLHAHVLLLPLLPLFALWAGEGRVDGGRLLPIVIVNLLLLAVALGNTWYLAALLSLFAVMKVLRSSMLPWWTPLPSLAALPWLWPASGQGLAIGLVQPAANSPLPAFLIVWGVPLLILLALLDRELLSQRARLLSVALLPVAALALVAPAAGLCAALALLLWLAGRDALRFWRALAISALVLLALPELLFIDDTYPPPDQRLNTVYKFSYAAWPLLMMAVARALLYQMHSSERMARYLPGAALLLLAPLMGYASHFLPQRLAQGLSLPLWDGVAPLARGHPQDVRLARWLEARSEPGDVCLEATGVSYQWSGRMSALAGCATVLGWSDHELLWRGQQKLIEARRRDVDTIYTTGDEALRRELLRRYDVDWVVLGEVERVRYGEAFTQLPGGGL
ncbi:MAG: DUF2298 domain-containing protein, partial [Chromatocurvus sp.]